MINLATPSKGRVYIVTVSEGDALCAAAALLVRHPEARVVVGHVNGLTRLLFKLATRSEGDGAVASAMPPGRKRRIRPLPNGEVHIVGMTAPSEEGLALALRTVRSAGIRAFWHDGRGVLAPGTRKHLAALCRVNAPARAGTHAAAVERFHQKGATRRTGLLTRVAAWVQPPEHSGGRRAAVTAELENNADMAAALLEYAAPCDTTEAFTERLRKWAVDGECDEPLLARWRDAGRPVDCDGRSPPMAALRDRIGRVAAYDRLAVLVLGPTGSGKEVAAAAVHRQSGRAGPFVAVNCATLAGDPGMVNARLFGHVKGAFTGAVADARGMFEAAEGGTLFLDEVAELPPETQARLLRVLEEGTYARIGEEHRARRADVRIVAATHRDLGALVESGRFREDLFYRLNVVPVRVPALAERPQDIDDLAYALHAHLCRKHRRTFPVLKPSHLETLKTYPWPGNIRQLRSILERALLLDMVDKLQDLLAEEQSIRGADRFGDDGSAATDRLQRGFDAFSGSGDAKAELNSRSVSGRERRPLDEDLYIIPWIKGGRPLTLDEVVRLHIANVKAHAGGKPTVAAKALGITYNRMRRLESARGGRKSAVFPDKKQRGEFST